MRDPAVESVEPFWGALEASWTLNKKSGNALNSINYSDAKRKLPGSTINY